MKKLGIIGGGQLGKMLAQAAKKKNYEVAILDSSNLACAKKIATYFIHSPFNDIQGIKKLFSLSNLLTFEFENVNYNSIKQIEKDTKKKVLPSLELLKISQNRILEKQKAEGINFKVAPYFAILSHADLLKAYYHFKSTQSDFIIKTAEGGYDGKGQWLITNDIEFKAFEQSHFHPALSYVAEKKIKIKKEVSCIVFRNLNNEFVNLPIAENIHENGILKLSIAPARINQKQEQNIIYKCQDLMTHLNVFGILAIELFIDENDNILFNEMAPRPHNSGHYSMNACNVSQFDLQITMLENKTFTQVKLLKPTVMLNILGQHYAKASTHQYGKNEFWYDYEKDSPKKNRKMGHINFCADTIDDLEKLIQKANSF